MAAQIRVAPSGTQVTDGIHRLGDHYVNWYVVEDGGRLTVIDTGLPGHWEQLPSLLTTIGRTIISDARSRSVWPHSRVSSSTATTQTVPGVGASARRSPRASHACGSDRHSSAT
jgi:hypothetical protein